MTNEEALNLGVMYYNGTLVEQDYDKAFELFKQAEALGNQEAYRWLGFCYYDGDGTRYCNEKAFKYFEKAIEFNPKDGKALWFLGNCYYYGNGTERNFQKDFEYYLQSAELGFQKAFFDLSHCYYKGKSVKKDLNKALYWAEKCINQWWIDKIKKEIKEEMEREK